MSIAILRTCAAWSVACAIAVAADPPLTTVRIASGLANPVFATASPGDAHRVFILEQLVGRIRVLKDGVLLGAPFLDISAILQSGGEWGLLGLAFHPDYATNGRFFIWYNRAPDGAVVLASYQVSSNPDVAMGTSGQVLLFQQKPFPTHNGGTVAFGPDGYLYLALGDGGGPGDPYCLAQNPTVILGKLLRIDVDGALPYAIPPTNPFVTTPGFRPEIWAVGVRNPYRFAFDRLTGDLYIGDVGQSAREEIDVQPASSAGGDNYGWKMQEGTVCAGAAGCMMQVPQCSSPQLVQPIHEYDHAQGDCAVIGGAVYRGCAMPALSGTYFFGDYCSGRIWSLRWQGGSVTGVIERTAELAPPAGQTIDLISSFGEDADGELLIVDHDGEIYRVVAAGPPSFTDLGYGKLGAGGIAPSLTLCGGLGFGESAVLRLRDAPPQKSAVLIASLSSNPQSVLLGTLVPSLPSFAQIYLSTGSEGAFAFPVLGSAQTTSVYLQCLIDDPAASAGVGFSNAVALHFGI